MSTTCSSPKISDSIHNIQMDGDFSFMRSGIGAPIQHEAQFIHTDELAHMQMVAAIMKLLMEDVVRSAARFTACCGRKVVSKEDTLRALRYEAHEFFERNGLERRFAESYAEELQHTYETDSDEDSSDDEDPMEMEYEPDSERFVHGTQEDAVFHGKVLGYGREWSGWEPDDPLIASVKRAIDAIP